MLAGRRYIVSGRVQGVGFRFFVRDAALREGIRGWVRNRDDGRVEIEGEGDADALLRFERALRRGPTGARVDDVIADPMPASGSRQAFTIEH